MRSQWFRSAVVVCAVVVLAACNSAQQPAEEALRVADESLVAVSEQAAMYVPDQLNMVTEAVAAARAQYDAGDYAAALTSAQALPAQIAELGSAVEAKKGELTGSWGEMSAQLTSTMATIGTEIERLAGLRKLPEGMTAEALTQAQTDFAAATQSMQDATSMFESGDLMGAVSAATSLQSVAAELSSRLGIGASM